jgi:non-ribosomal peptide synthase protein (TIGR01720 family)
VARRYGQGYGLLRWGRQAPELTGLPHPQISFNYLGIVGAGGPVAQSPIGLANEPRGAERAGENPRSALWDITAVIVEGELQLEWIFSPAQYRVETIQSMGLAVLQNVRTLLETQKPLISRSFTPQDFPYAGLDEKKLSKVLNRLERDRGKAER